MFIELKAALIQERDRLDRLLEQSERFQKVLIGGPAVDELPALIAQIKSAIDQIEQTLAHETNSDAQGT